MTRSEMARLISAGVAEIEAAYKIEMRLAGKGHRTNAESDRATSLYYKGNDKLKKVMAELTKGEVERLKGESGIRR